MGTPALERCQQIMRWVHQHPGRMRKHRDIAEALGLETYVVSNCINKNFPECFTRRNGIGVMLTGIYPEDITFDLDQPFDQKVVHTRQRNVKPKHDASYEAMAMQGLDALYKSYTDRTFMQVLNSSDEDGLKFISAMGELMHDMVEQMFSDSVVGTTAQLEWTYTHE